MSDEQEVIDPFAPVDRGNKTKFGKLKLFANPIKMVKVSDGGIYTIPSIHDRDGNVKEWRGKKIDKASKQFHVVMHVKANDKDENEYEMTRDALTTDKSYKELIFPALTKVFGKELPTKAYAFVQFEEVPSGEKYTDKETGTEKDRTVWQVVKQFKSEQLMKAAEKEYFSRFSNGNGATEEAPADENAAPDWLVNLKPKLDKLRKAGKSDAEIGEQYDATAEQVAAVLA